MGARSCCEALGRVLIVSWGLVDGTGTSFPVPPGSPALTSEGEVPSLGHTCWSDYSAVLFGHACPLGACSLLLGTELDQLQRGALGTCIRPLDSI